MDLLKWYNFFKIYYLSLAGLIVGIVIWPYTLLLVINQIVAAGSHVKEKAFLAILVVSIWGILWYWKREHFPHVTKNKIGIVIAIQTENDKQKIRYQVDFVNRLNQSLRSQNLGQIFEFLTLTDYYQKKASEILNRFVLKKKELRLKNEDDRSFNALPKEFEHFKKLRNRTKGHLFIWGTIIERSDEENKYVINMDMLVIHKPIPAEMTDKFAREMLSVLPRELNFYEKFELFGFRVTSDTVYFAARYITGIAAFISGDPKAALDLHLGLKRQIQEEEINPNIIDKSYFQARLNELILTEKLTIAKFDYHYGNKSEGLQGTLKECIHKLKNPYDALIFAAYIAFNEMRDPLLAIKYLNKARKCAQTNPLWLYNKAFILMYIGKIQNSLRCYSQLFRGSSHNENEIVDDCIDFNENLLHTEPDFIPSYFIIGALYYKKKNNFPLAFEYFVKFQNLARNDAKYSSLIKVAETYLKEISNFMKIRLKKSYK